MSNKVLLFVDSAAFGGVEQAVLQLAEGLDRTLWEPVLVYHPSPDLHPLIQRADRLEMRRIETPPMPLGTGGMRKIPAFMDILRRERPVLFHAHLSWPLACKWGIVASIFAGIPATIVTAHLYLDIPYTKMARLQQRLMAGRIGKYIAVSNGVAEKMAQTFLIPKEKIRVIHNAVQVTAFSDVSQPAELVELRKRSKRPLVITVARLDEQKGHPYLLEAACQVPEANFVLVGDGPERAALEEQTRRLGLEDRVFFFGFQKNIQDWLAASDVFVLPSLYEGLPISILEAMAAGKPVIASGIPGSRDAVCDQVSGLLVPPRDVNSLAGALHSLLGDAALCQRLGQAGREIAAQKFSARRMVHQITDVYEECLTGRM